MEELLALPEDQALLRITPVGVVFGETPGAGSAVLLDLEPGRYIAACLMPSEGSSDGATHATDGMVAEFEVV